MAEQKKNTTVKAASKPSDSTSEDASAMDYSEHDKTYELFIWLSKWTVVFCVALLIAMMFGFFGGGGLIGGTILMLVLMAAAFFVI